MTRKDFQAIARAINAAFEKNTIATRVAVVDELIRAIRDSNKNFDADKFRKACGV